MKIFVKYRKYVLLLLIALLYASCSHDAVGPVSGTTAKLKIDLTNAQKGGNNTQLADKLLNKTRAFAKTSNAVDTTTIDEVKLLVLDMTKWNSWEEFISHWWATNQYGLLDTAIENQMIREGKDDWDIYSTVFKSYTGTAYTYVGDYGFMIESGKASGTIYLNPGVNYFYYTFRASGKTISAGEDTVVVKENEENLIEMGMKSLNYSGTWSTNGTADTSSGALNLNLMQSSDELSGTFTFGNSSCYSNFTILSGSISGSSIYLYGVYNSYYMNLYGTVSGENVQGSWSVSPSCGSVSGGTFTALRISR